MTSPISRKDILPANQAERELVAAWMAASEPWLTLGTSLEKCRAGCSDPSYQIFVAHLKNIPCGAIILHDKGLAGSPYIKSLIVAAGFRDQGIGEDLVRFAEDHYHFTAKHIFLCVSSFNVEAKKFYDRLGYKQVGEFKDYILPGLSELLLHKVLHE